ncbi:YhgE/Pip domain-containing protein [Frigoribacterium sp. CFBP9039]|uniref:YhgE/Pip domain-containing protein n=1 Tax=Frigoribacterium sp. CFBP9029 TaxID=3096541 RepID=UPI002A6A35A1|nr:YhgE/Pip domain-containing protein [Frigoribacterium sp. CFBP9039]MDY0946668.1 YhgE/Pip domain-containing protein [Frigoribacterium sp. CFBP9039]
MKIVTLVRSEFQRLTSTGLARLALVALMTVPLLYGGLYLWANQDPYAKLDKVPAALVDADSGAVSDGETVDYGADVTKEVLDGGDFDWHETTAEEARAGLEDGTYDFTFTIPTDFSADLVSASSDDPQRAQIVLATNDSNSYLSTTIAEQAAKTIRASVTERVGKEAATQLLVGLSDIRTSLGDAADGAAQLNDGLGTSVGGADRLATGAADARDGADRLAAGASDAHDGADRLATGAASADTGARTLADGVGALSTGATTLDAGLQQLRSSTAELPAQTQALADGAAQVAAGNDQLATTVAGAAADSQTAVDALPEAQAAAQSDIAAALAAQGYDADQIAAIAATFAPVTDDLTTRLTGANTQLQALNGSVAQLSAGADQVAAGTSTLAEQTPALTSGISSAADGSAQLSTGAATAASGATDLATGLGMLDSGAASLADGLGTLDAGATTLASGLDTLATGTVDLHDGLVQLRDGSTTLSDGLQNGLAQIPASTDSSRDDQASAISDPVSVTDRALTSAGTYGAGLAPFFISLAAWIGIYALFLIVKPLSKRAITAVKAPGRVVAAGWLAPALLGLVQMVALFGIVTGPLGFDVVHPWAMVGLMVLASATFAAIIMMLNVLLGSVGQFLGLVLMVVQLVTAGGTFPWQTLPAPLAALHFALPMSYATDGLRQVMYGGSLPTAAGDAGVLACWLLGALLVSYLAAARMTRRRTLRDLRPSLIG